MSEAEAIDALDELLERDLVRQTDVPRRFRFRHPLVRGAVYTTAPGGWRLGAHERTAAALAARGAPAAARAHHVEYAARHGDAEAIAVLAEAGRELLTGRPPVRRAGSPPHCACCRRARRRRSASGCCWRMPVRSPRPAGSMRRARPSWTASSCHHPMPSPSAWS